MTVYTTTSNNNNSLKDRAELEKLQDMTLQYFSTGTAEKYSITDLKKVGIIMYRKDKITLNVLVRDGLLKLEIQEIKHEFNGFKGVEKRKIYSITEEGKDYIKEKKLVEKMITFFNADKTKQYSINDLKTTGIITNPEDRATLNSLVEVEILNLEVKKIPLDTPKHYEVQKVYSWAKCKTRNKEKVSQDVNEYSG